MPTPCDLFLRGEVPVLRRSRKLGCWRAFGEPLVVLLMVKIIQRQLYPAAAAAAAGDRIHVGGP